MQKYSVENDLYRDSNLERILDATELRDHKLLMAEVCRWFACEVDKYKRGAEFMSNPQLTRLIPIAGLTCYPAYLREIGFYEPPAELVQSIFGDYARVLRGELLYEIIVRFTHAPDRRPRKYNHSQLHELATVYGMDGQLMQKSMTAN